LAYKALYEANIWNGVTVYYRNKQYVELWGFATTRDNLSFQEFFTQNQNLMNVYMLHFKENYRDVIFPKNSSILLLDTNIVIPVLSCNNSQIQEFIKNNPISKIHLDGYANTISTKQAICLSLYTQGWSMKAIAELLELSVRTVECNIHNSQMKLRCTQRAQTSKILQSTLPIGFHDLINSYIK
jgi:DNA-binding CsgD family transcriptional regulator